MKFDCVIAERKDKILYRDGNRCVKVFSTDYSKSDVLNEALNQARIEEIGLNIPEVLEVTTVDGQWAIVSQFVNGKTMAQLMLENPDKKDEYLNLLVDLQLEIHEKTCPHLNKLKDKLNEKIYWSDLDATTRYDLHTRLEDMPKHNKVCHGDFNPSNILIDEVGIPYILDWSHATQGNASADIARTYLLFWLSGDKDGAKKYLDLFCEKTNTDKQYVQKWLPIVAASQSVTGTQQERDLLLACVTGMDCE